MNWHQLLHIDVQAGRTIASTLLLEKMDRQGLAVKVLAEIRAYFGELWDLGDVDENAQELTADLVAFLLVSGPNLQAELDFLLSELDQLWSLIMLLDKPQHFDENQTVKAAFPTISADSTCSLLSKEPALHVPREHLHNSSVDHERPLVLRIDADLSDQHHDYALGMASSGFADHLVDAPNNLIEHRELQIRKAVTKQLGKK